MPSILFHSNTQPIEYSFTDAAALANTFDSAASKLQEYHGRIRLEGIRAAEEFRGAVRKPLRTELQTVHR